MPSSSRSPTDGGGHVWGLRSVLEDEYVYGSAMRSSLQAVWAWSQD